MTYPETHTWLEEVPFLSDRDREALTGGAFRDLVGL
jgi:hypothetical protein